MTFGLCSWRLIGHPTDGEQDELSQFISDLVINVCGALRWHLLYNVHRVSIVPAHLLIVWAVIVLCSPQRDDDVTWLSARISTAFRASQCAKGQGSCPLLCMFAVPFSDLDKQNY